MQAAVIDRAGDNADIARTVRDQADDLVAQALLEVDADIGIGHQERAQGLRQEFGERISVGEHAHLAGEPARIGAQILLQALALRQDRARMLQQRAAGLGGCYAGAAAHQQFGAERQFHLADAGRGGGQRQIGARRAMRDAARLDNLAEQVEIGEVEAHPATTFLFCEGTLRKTHIV